MGKIATIAAALAVLGSGAALAQGAPPGFAPWQSGWPGFVQAHPSQETSDREGSVTRSEDRSLIARRSGSVPVRATAQNGDRKG
jgi:hypothetical protein